MLRSVYISTVCNAHASLLLFFVTGVHTHTHTPKLTQTHTDAAVCSSHLRWKHSGEKKAESRNGEADRRREVSQSARSLHRCCQNAILFNKLGKIGDFSLTQSVRELPQLSGSNRLCLSFSAAPGKRFGTPNKPTNRPSRCM